MSRLLTGLCALLLLGAASADDPLVVAGRCEAAPALSPFELADSALVRPPRGVPPPPCVRRLMRAGARAVRVVAPLLSHAEPGVARRAAWFLGLLGRGEAVAALVDGLPAAPTEGARAVIEALGRIGDERAAAALSERVGAGGAWLELGSATALASIGGPVAIEALRPCAAETCSAAWGAATGIDQLQEQPPPPALVGRCADVVECWRAALAEPGPHRALAVRWLGRLGAAQDALVALRDPSPEVRRQTREVLLIRCRGACADAAAKLVVSPELGASDRVWLSYVVLRAGRDHGGPR